MRLRFRLRTLTLVVAAVAILMAAGSMWRRSAAYRSLAASHTELEWTCRQWERRHGGAAEEQVALKAAYLSGVTASRQDFPGRGGSHEDAQVNQGLLDGFDGDIAFYRNAAAPFARKADYHGVMRGKYERAARYPWLPVSPDPPEPE